MSSIGSSGLRERAGGALLALYMLAGRWGVMRLFEAPSNDDLYLSILELRFFIVLGLVAVAFVQRDGRAAAGEKSGILPFIISLNAFFIYFLLAALWSPDGRYALIKTIDALLVIFATASAYKLMTRARAATTRTWFWGFVVVSMGVLGLIAIGKAVAAGPERLAVLGGGPNVFGRMMSLLCLASLFFWRRKGGAAFIVSSVAAVLLVILSGSRGSIVAATAGAAVFFLVERVKLRSMATFVLGACLLGSALFLYTPVGQKAVATYEQRVNKLLIQERYSAGREDLYRDAYDMGLKSPIFGAGLAAFPALGYGPYAHNFFLEIFSESGLVGLALLIPPFFLFGRRCWRIRGRLDGAAVAAFVFTMGAIQFSGDFYDSRALFVFMLMAFLPRDAAG